jgi:hypothetical protein
LGGGAFDHLYHDIAFVRASRNVIKNQFIGATIVVVGGEDDGVAGVTVIDERDPFDDPPSFDIEAGNNAAFQHD